MVALHGQDRGGAHDASPAAKAAEVPALTVERITHQDVPEICALYKRVWDAPPGPGTPPELLKAWQPTPLEFTSWMEGVTYFAARRAGRLVGVVGCEVAHGNCRLLHLVVDPEARRQGVATALVGAGVEWARHASAVEVWSLALARFTGVQALFKRLGFVEGGLLRKHEFGEDVRLYDRLL